MLAKAAFIKQKLKLNRNTVKYCYYNLTVFYCKIFSNIFNIACDFKNYFTEAITTVFSVT